MNTLIKVALTVLALVLPKVKKGPAVPHVAPPGKPKSPATPSSLG